MKSIRICLIERHGAAIQLPCGDNIATQLRSYFLGVISTSP